MRTQLFLGFVAFVLATRPGDLVAAPVTPTDPRTGPDLVAADSCDQLLAWYVDNAVDRVTAWGWDDRPVGVVTVGSRPA